VNPIQICQLFFSARTLINIIIKEEELDPRYEIAKPEKNGREKR
jgi:hypothetical protein